MKPRRAQDYRWEQRTLCPTPAKEGYSAKREAKSALDNLRAKFGKATDEPKPYLCKCGLWHLGRRNKRLS